MRKLVLIVLILLSVSIPLRAQEYSEPAICIDSLDRNYLYLIDKLNNSNDDVSLILEELLSIGERYLECGLLNKVETCYQYCLKYLDSLDLERVNLVATAYGKLASVYERGGNNQLAFDALIKSYGIYKKNQLYSQDSALIDTLRNLRQRIVDYDYINKSISNDEFISSDGSILLPEILIVEESHALLMVAPGYNTINNRLTMNDEVVSLLRDKGEGMKKEGNYKEAESVFRACLEINKLTDNHRDAVKSCLDLSELYTLANNYDKAFESSYESLEQYKVVEDNSAEYVIDFEKYVLYDNIVDLYIKTNKFYDGFSYAKILYELSSKLVDNKIFPLNNNIVEIKKLNFFFTEIMMDPAYKGELDSEYTEFQKNIVLIASMDGENCIQSNDKYEPFIVVGCEGWNINCFVYNNTKEMVEKQVKQYILYKDGVFYAVPCNKEIKLSLDIGSIKPEQKDYIKKQYKKLKVLKNRKYKSVRILRRVRKPVPIAINYNIFDILDTEESYLLDGEI